jgi:ketosteroid isomerase-like protein
MPQAREITASEVHEFLHRFVETYEKGDKAFFDCFSKNASVFTISSPTRIDGADEFRRGFQPFLEGKSSRQSQILSPAISIEGGTAVVTYHNRIQVDGRSTNLRSTLVLTRDDSGRLRASHLHNSPLESPPVRPRTVEELHLIEERVATTIGAVGTPK